MSAPALALTLEERGTVLVALTLHLANLGALRRASGDDPHSEAEVARTRELLAREYGLPPERLDAIESDRRPTARELELAA